MTAVALLDRLDGVRSTGNGRWLARCPAHSDRHPSLSVRELDDGRILVHDFAGCSTGDVLAAAGLTIADLFPKDHETPDHRRRGERRPFPAADVLRALAYEVKVVLIFAVRLAKGLPLSEADQARLLLAAERINTAVLESGHA